MRIFVALDIDDAIRQRIARFMEGVHNFAPDARWVRPESMHVTLKFIGEKSEAEVGEIKQALEGIEASALEIRFHGYGFFPTAKAARVFWVGIEAGPQIEALAAKVDSTMATLGMPKEEHAFTPHITLARAGGRSASPRGQKDDGRNQAFHKLQEKLSAMTAPDFGTMTARAFFLYQSQLSQGGSRYTKLSAFALV
jgi:2'-5' RNA ligase